MKTRITRIVSLICLLAMTALLMTSCAVETDYVTKDELDQLLDSRVDGSIVEAGDSYEVTINSNGAGNIVPASKSLLSAVSVYCNFKMNYSSSYFPGMSTGTRQYSSAGAGVIYSLDKNKGDAFVITNYHVVYDYRANTANHVSDDIKLYLYGMEATDYAIPATYVGGSMVYDLAVLKVEGSRVLAESNAVAASFADSDKVSVLETAIAVGNPESKGISITVGYVNVDSEYLTMLGSDNSTEVQMRVMRIDAAVNSGNSGGGLFNEKGELIGIVNAKMSDSTVDNIGYAIPSNIVKYIANNIIYYCNGTDLENVYRCLVGITVGASRYYTEYDTETGKVHKHETVIVEQITSGGIADGRLQTGDEIVAITIDGVRYEVNRMYNVVDSMLNARVGSSVVVEIKRDGGSMTVELPITEDSLTKSK